MPAHWNMEYVGKRKVKELARAFDPNNHVRESEPVAKCRIAMPTCFELDGQRQSSKLNKYSRKSVPVMDERCKSSNKSKITDIRNRIFAERKRHLAELREQAQQQRRAALDTELETKDRKIADLKAAILENHPAGSAIQQTHFVGSAIQQTHIVGSANQQTHPARSLIGKPEVTLAAKKSFPKPGFITRYQEIHSLELAEKRIKRLEQDFRRTRQELLVAKRELQTLRGNGNNLETIAEQSKMKEKQVSRLEQGFRQYFHKGPISLGRRGKLPTESQEETISKFEYMKEQERWQQEFTAEQEKWQQSLRNLTQQLDQCRSHVECAPLVEPERQMSTSCSPNIGFSTTAVVNHDEHVAMETDQLCTLKVTVEKLQTRLNGILSENIQLKEKQETFNDLSSDLEQALSEARLTVEQNERLSQQNLEFAKSIAALKSANVEKDKRIELLLIRLKKLRKPRRGSDTCLDDEGRLLASSDMSVSSNSLDTITENITAETKQFYCGDEMEDRFRRLSKKHLLLQRAFATLAHSPDARRQSLDSGFAKAERQRLKSQIKRLEYSVRSMENEKEELRQQLYEATERNELLEFQILEWENTEGTNNCPGVTPTSPQCSCQWPSTSSVCDRAVSTSEDEGFTSFDENSLVDLQNTSLEDIKLRLALIKHRPELRQPDKAVIEIVHKLWDRFLQVQNNDVPQQQNFTESAPVDPNASHAPCNQTLEVLKKELAAAQCNCSNAEKHNSDLTSSMTKMDEELVAAKSQLAEIVQELSDTKLDLKTASDQASQMEILLREKECELMGRSTTDEDLMLAKAHKEELENQVINLQHELDRANLAIDEMSRNETHDALSAEPMATSIRIDPDWESERDELVDQIRLLEEKMQMGDLTKHRLSCKIDELETKCEGLQMVISDSQALTDHRNELLVQLESNERRLAESRDYIQHTKEAMLELEIANSQLRDALDLYSEKIKKFDLDSDERNQKINELELELEFNRSELLEHSDRSLMLKLEMDRTKESRDATEQKLESRVNELEGELSLAHDEIKKVQMMCKDLQNELLAERQLDSERVSAIKCLETEKQSIFREFQQLQERLNWHKKERDEMEIDRLTEAESLQHRITALQQEVTEMKETNIQTENEIEKMKLFELAAQSNEIQLTRDIRKLQDDKFAIDTALKFKTAELEEKEDRIVKLNKENSCLRTKTTAVESEFTDYKKVSEEKLKHLLSTCNVLESELINYRENLDQKEMLENTTRGSLLEMQCKLAVSENQVQETSNSLLNTGLKLAEVMEEIGMLQSECEELHRTSFEKTEEIQRLQTESAAWSAKETELNETIVSLNSEIAQNCSEMEKARQKLMVGAETESQLRLIIQDSESRLQSVEMSLVQLHQDNNSLKLSITAGQKNENVLKLEIQDLKSILDDFVNSNDANNNDELTDARNDNTRLTEELLHSEQRLSQLQEYNGELEQQFEIQIVTAGLMKNQIVKLQQQLKSLEEDFQMRNSQFNEMQNNEETEIVLQRTNVEDQFIDDDLMETNVSARTLDGEAMEQRSPIGSDIDTSLALQHHIETAHCIMDFYFQLGTVQTPPSLSRKDLCCVGHSSSNDRLNNVVDESAMSLNPELNVVLAVCRKWQRLEEKFFACVEFPAHATKMGSDFSPVTELLNQFYDFDGELIEALHKLDNSAEETVQQTPPLPGTSKRLDGLKELAFISQNLAIKCKHRIRLLALCEVIKSQLDKSLTDGKSMSILEDSGVIEGSPDSSMITDSLLDGWPALHDYDRTAQGKKLPFSSIERRDKLITQLLNEVNSCQSFSVLIETANHVKTALNEIQLEERQTSPLYLSSTESDMYDHFGAHALISPSGSNKSTDPRSDSSSPPSHKVGGHYRIPARCGAVHQQLQGANLHKAGRKDHITVTSSSDEDNNTTPERKKIDVPCPQSFGVMGQLDSQTFFVSWKKPEVCDAVGGYKIYNGKCLISTFNSIHCTKAIVHSPAGSASRLIDLCAYHATSIKNESHRVRLNLEDFLAANHHVTNGQLMTPTSKSMSQLEVLRFNEVNFMNSENASEA